jgi:hypothetical protein
LRRNAIIALTFIVAAAVGFESWQAAAAAAETGDRPHPGLWPVTLEAFIAVLVLVYWEARSEGRTAWQARALLALTTLLASTIQVLDVDPGADHVLGVITAGWTPIALLLTVELATWLLYGNRSPASPPEPVPTATPAAPTASAGVATNPPAAAAAAVEPGPMQPPPRSRPAAKPARTVPAAKREQVDLLLARGWTSARAIAREVRTDPAAVRAHMAQRQGNGHRERVEVRA